MAFADDFDDEPVAPPAAEKSEKRIRQYLPSMRCIAGMAALGIALALGWRYSGLEQWVLTPTASTAEAAPAAAAPAPESELVRMGREVESLKKTLNEVIAANHQLTATVNALRVGQEELKHRAANVQTDGWHAQASAMKYHMVAQPKSSTGSIRPRPPARAEARRAPRPAEHAPLQLTSPRP